MTIAEYIQVGVVLILALLIWIAIKFIRYLKSRNNNTELWGTIFEGITNKLIDLEPIKKPDVYIEKKVRKSGQGKDEQE